MLKSSDQPPAPLWKGADRTYIIIDLLVRRPFCAALLPALPYTQR